MSSTKKVKSAGRYHARYGIGIRRRLIDVEEKQKKKQACQSCGFKKVKRKAPGIFFCTKCGSQFAGGAFVSHTLSGSIVSKMVSQKSFLPSLNELVKAREKETGKPENEPDAKAHAKEDKKNRGDE